MTYTCPDKFLRDNVVALFLRLCVVIVSHSEKGGVAEGVVCV